MNDFAVAVQIVQSDQHLLGHAADNRDRDPFVIVPFHDFQKVHA